MGVHLGQNPKLHPAETLLTVRQVWGKGHFHAYRRREGDVKGPEVSPGAAQVPLPCFPRN